MVNSNNQTELRSEKVRNIVGQIPPFLLRKGILIITIVIIAILIIGYFMKYPETVQTNITLKQDNSVFYGEALIPYSYLHKIEKSQPVNTSLIGYPTNKFGLIKGVIYTIYPHPIHQNSEQFFKVDIRFVDQDFNNIILYPDMNGTSSITYSSKSLLFTIFPFLHKN